MSDVYSANEMGVWHFDEGNGMIAYDSSVNNNDGVINGASWVPGIINTALSFNNFNNSVIVVDSDSLDIRHAITIEAWLKPLYSDAILDSFEFDAKIIMNYPKSSFFLSFLFILNKNK